MANCSSTTDKGWCGLTNCCPSAEVVLRVRQSSEQSPCILLRPQDLCIQPHMVVIHDALQLLVQALDLHHLHAALSSMRLRKSKMLGCRRATLSFTCT